jgi:hypothetical protein
LRDGERLSSLQSKLPDLETAGSVWGASGETYSEELERFGVLLSERKRNQKNE